ncbi:PREDICTED: putative invertase inhibitor [Populus euphratica]|uniref:Invertase inhibitor n=1 Tax=Populus euphratica TaxID=75702 RepID=A0AAJ6UL62_POPEU|nr:PREDICTED: putative invertase inhibitor [Populus euphratica]
MNHISFSSFALCFLFFFLVTPTPNNSISTLDASTIDITNRTCKKCAEDSKTFSYDFCISSLQAIPVSHVTNIHGLAIIGLELALENATNTISTIKYLLSYETLDRFALVALQDCLELYADALVTIVDGVAAFLTEHYSVAEVKVGAVMEASTTCEEGFSEKTGVVSPLTEENYNLFQLSDIALCIIHMLSLAVCK